MSINVVIVDDEKPAIRMLQHMLQQYDDLKIKGIYTNPLKAFDDIIKFKPDVVFLDVNMPQIRGLDLGSCILEASPNTNLIFVTAYDMYAVEAFELNALDYLLKPISAERLKKAVERIRNKHLAKQVYVTKKLMIKCLGGGLLYWDNQPPMKFRAEKTRELFLYLLHNRNHSITKEEILDHVWTEDNPERAIRQLYNGIYYIRKALEEYGVDKSQINIDCNYSMKIVGADIDVDTFCKLGNDINSISQNKLENMEALYTGEYLQGEDHLWVYSKREELARLYQVCLIKLSKIYLEQLEFEKAENKLLKAYEINPYDEGTSEALMKLYIMTDRKGMGVKHFHAYVELIRKELGIKPNDKLIKLYRSIITK
jgi:Response regulator containing CheY-like receiver and SARP domains